MTTQKPRTMQVTVTDPCNGNTTRVVRIKNIIPTKSGLLGQTVGEGFNVFRPWNSKTWMENVTSSTRFSIETEGLSAEEMSIFINEREARKAFMKAATPGFVVAA